MAHPASRCVIIRDELATSLRSVTPAPVVRSGATGPLLPLCSQAISLDS